MLKYTFILFSIISISCTKVKLEKGTCTESGSRGLVNFNFKALTSGAEIENTREYLSTDTIRYRISDLKFYLSFMAVNSDNDTIGCIDHVKLFNMKDSSLGNFTLQFPSDRYDALIMGVGLNPQINGTDPSSLEAEHPLSANQGTYWSWANGYKFLQIEGMTATHKNDTSVLSNPLLLHVGTNDCYLERVVLTDFSVKRRDVTILNMKLNLDQIYNAIHELDIIEDNYTQTANSEEAELAFKIIENFSYAIEISN